MNAKTRRHISAWVLLAVFVSMLTLSSLHVHSTSSVSGDNCSECVKHHCHGHLGEQTPTMHDCVLCHFLTLPFVAAATIVALFYKNTYRKSTAQRRYITVVGLCGIIIPRAPPSL